jgi:Flp pilus assembly pilin Flp
MRSFVLSWLAEEKGATSIEYALIASFVFFAIISGVTSAGQEVAKILDLLGAEFKKV